MIKIKEMPENIMNDDGTSSTIYKLFLASLLGIPASGVMLGGRTMAVKTIGAVGLALSEVLLFGTSCMLGGNWYYKQVMEVAEEFSNDEEPN